VVTDTITEGGTVRDKTSLDALFGRRPEIGHIELSCENTNTLVPYVDLVNEVLENAVSPLLFHIDNAALIGDLDKELTSSRLINQFGKNGFSLSDDATVAVEVKGSRWSITERGWKYILSKETKLIEVWAIPQTGGTSREVSANPEHVNRAAYGKLARVVYPWNLPFSLSTEEVRLYLEHLGVRRHELMAAFQSGGETPQPSSRSIDIEALGLTHLEEGLISTCLPR
jgi:hypothetical protein